MSSSNSRKSRACWAVALWVVGFELLPLVHVAGHGALGAHRHEGAATSFDGAEQDDFRASLNAALADLGHAYAHDAAHARGAAHQHGVRPQHSTSDSDAALVQGIAEPEHGAHSVAHRDLAAASAPMAPPAPAPARLVPDLAVPRTLTLALSRVVPARVARGPPTV